MGSGAHRELPDPGRRARGRCRDRRYHPVRRPPSRRTRSGSAAVHHGSRRAGPQPAYPGLESVRETLDAARGRNVRRVPAQHDGSRSRRAPRRSRRNVRPGTAYDGSPRRPRRAPPALHGGLGREVRGAGEILAQAPPPDERRATGGVPAPCECDLRDRSRLHRASVTHGASEQAGASRPRRPARCGAADPGRGNRLRRRRGRRRAHRASPRGPPGAPGRRTRRRAGTSW